MFTERINYKKKRILRILVYLNNGSIVTGSGFFIDNNGRLLTCFHVVFSKGLKDFRKDQVFISIQGNSEHLRLDTWFRNNISKIEVENYCGIKEELKLEKFDEKYDIVLLKLHSQRSLKDIKYCKLDFKATLKQGDLVFFGGFPVCVPYNNTETPFAINTGMISCFPETTITGERYEHIQINSINLGGNSGAPLFKRNSNSVIGIINGNMNWGSDVVLMQDNSGRQFVESLRVPLSIAYATSIKFLKQKTLIFT